jgi:Lon protease-like protein
VTALPDELPIFPLDGVLLLPGGRLPLNIFEPRYRAMVEDALKNGRIIGMIQPRNAEEEAGPGEAPVFATGCAGKIIAFEELEDGRYLITLTGVSRFRVAKELPLQNGYRRVAPDWSPFAADLTPPGGLDIDRAKLKTLLAGFFDMHELSCDWAAIDSAPDDTLMTCLAMICPFDAGEKQALLEAPCCKTRAALFMSLLEMAVRSRGPGHECCGGHCH